MGALQKDQEVVISLVIKFGDRVKCTENVPISQFWGHSHQAIKLGQWTVWVFHLRTVWDHQTGALQLVLLLEFPRVHISRQRWIIFISSQQNWRLFDAGATRGVPKICILYTASSRWRLLSGRIPILQRYLVPKIPLQRLPRKNTVPLCFHRRPRNKRHLSFLPFHKNFAHVHQGSSQEGPHTNIPMQFIDDERRK